jgi:hypothetical protein
VASQVPNQHRCQAQITANVMVALDHKSRGSPAAEGRVLMLNIREPRGLVCSGFRVRDETVAAPFRGTGVPFCADKCLFLF